MVAVAVPSLTRQFHSIDQVGWYGAAFYMTNCTFQLLWGKFFTYINLKWSYILTILIFEIGLLVSGSAQTSAVFIAGRAIAGIGSGGMLTGSIVVITCSVAPEKRAKYIGWLGSMYGLAYGLGYLIGGVFADHVTWRWCFYINLPPGALVVVVMMAFLPAIASDPTVLQWPRKQRVAQLDIFGAIVLLGVLSCLLVALQWAGDIYSWFSGQVMTLLFASGILLTIWILIQYTRDERAMVPIRLIKLRSVTAGIFYGFCAGGVFYSTVYYLSIWFQAVKGKSAFGSGVAALPMFMGQTVAIILAGVTQRFVHFLPPYMLSSAIICSIASGLFYTWHVHTSTVGWVCLLLFFGFGQGLGWMQPMAIAQQYLADRDLSIGMTLMNASRLLGGAIFLPAASYIFNMRLTSNLHAIGNGLNVTAVLAAGATDLTSVVDPTYLPAVRQAYNKAIQQVYILTMVLSVFMLLAALVVEWRPVWRRTPIDAAVADGCFLPPLKEPEKIHVPKVLQRVWVRYLSPRVRRLLAVRIRIDVVDPGKRSSSQDTVSDHVSI